jgi:hypothetical protein
VSSINQLDLERKLFYSKKITAAKKPLQWKGHCSDRAATADATAAKDTIPSEHRAA